MENKKKLSLKLSLKKETLRELDTTQVGVLDQVVGGTCPCTSPVARTAPVCEDTVY